MASKYLQNLRNTALAELIRYMCQRLFFDYLVFSIHFDNILGLHLRHAFNATNSPIIDCNATAKREKCDRATSLILAPLGAIPCSMWSILSRGTCRVCSHGLHGSHGHHKPSNSNRFAQQAFWQLFPCPCPRRGFRKFPRPQLKYPKTQSP